MPGVSPPSLEARPEEEQPSSPPSPPAKKPGRFPLIPLVVIGGILGLLLVALVVLLVLRPALFPPSGKGIPLEITRISSTSPLPTPPPPFVEVGGTPLALPIPVALEAGGRSFPVQPASPGEEGWPAPGTYPGAAIWAYGTVVNYVVGLEATEDHRTLFADLQPEASLQLRLSNGVRLIFRVVRQETVQSTVVSSFPQSHPSLTLLLLGEGEQPAVFADLERVEEPAPQAGGMLVEVRQPVQIGDVRVAVIEGHVAAGGDLPAGTMAYLVEFSLQNTGSTTIDTGALVMELMDGVDNRYLPSPSIASRGQYGPLRGPLAPGAEVNATAGYIVPDTLVGPALIWVFGLQPGSDLQVRFRIPYTPSAPTAWAEVNVIQAFLGEGGETLHIVAEVANEGGSPLSVTVDDVSLSSSAGPGELRVAAPPFPWTIAAGEHREVELQFARPDASTCIVTILGYTFEISGLP